jgi:hypothetical protein
MDLSLCVLAAPSPCWLKGDASFLGNKEEALSKYESAGQVLHGKFV